MGEQPTYTIESALVLPIPRILEIMAMPPPAIIANLRIQGTAIAHYDTCGLHAVVGNAAERETCFRIIAMQVMAKFHLALYFDDEVGEGFLNNFACHLAQLKRPTQRPLFPLVNKLNKMSATLLDAVGRIESVCKKAGVSFWVGIDSEVPMAEKKPLIDEFCTEYNSRYRFLDGELLYIGRPGMKLENVAGCRQ